MDAATARAMTEAAGPNKEVQAAIERAHRSIERAAKEGRGRCMVCGTHETHAAEVVAALRREGFAVNVVRETIGGVGLQCPDYHASWI